jgi:DNA-binding response OmpR family regulator
MQSFRARIRRNGRTQALENGAEALLTKPIDFTVLRSEIDTRIEKAIDVGYWGAERTRFAHTELSRC